MISSSVHKFRKKIISWKTQNWFTSFWTTCLQFCRWLSQMHSLTKIESWKKFYWSTCDESIDKSIMAHISIQRQELSKKITTELPCWAGLFYKGWFVDNVCVGDSSYSFPSYPRDMSPKYHSYLITIHIDVFQMYHIDIKKKIKWYI